jgi:phage terminase large subunit-like protein
MELTVHLPKPHNKQADFMHSAAKRKCIVAGRRGGKTTGAATLAVVAMLKGKRVLEAAPTLEQTEAFWEACKAYCSELIAAGVLYKNDSRRILQMPNGARIRTKTAWDADTLRGDYADLLILDEYATMKPSAWEQVGAPMLLDNNGDAVFIGTPKRRNHFHSLYTRAIADDSGRWGAWHFTSLDNPHLSREALDEITADLTRDAYRQEILAEFLENAGAVFRNIAACCVLEPSMPAEHENHEIVCGIDWGKQSDYTVVSVGCRDCQQEVELDRFQGISYHLARQRLAALIERWDAYDVLAESNAMGEPVIDEMQYTGLPVRGFQTTAASKPPLIENLALCLEREEVHFIDNAIGTAELEAYEMKVSANTGRPTYSAPEGVHDDIVMARALMCNALQLRGNWMELI